MDANVTAWLIFLAIGAAAGWIAGRLMKGGGFGVVGNIIVGIIGAFVGAWLFRALGVGVSAGLLGSLITAVIGSVVLLFVVGLLKRV